MAVSELVLLGLALNLATNPSATDIQKYQSLNQDDQIKIQQLVDQKDSLPVEIEKLKTNGLSYKAGNIQQAPTWETVM